MDVSNEETFVVKFTFSVARSIVAMIPMDRDERAIILFRFGF